MMAKASCLTGKISCRSSSRRKLRGWNTLLVFALTPGPPAHKLRYLNKKVNRSANEMLFCLAFREVFFSSPFLNSNQQLNNNEIWRSFALWFLFLSVEDFWRTFSSVRWNFFAKEKQWEATGESFSRKNPSKVNGKSRRFMNFKLAISLWIALNWDFARLNAFFPSHFLPLAQHAAPTEFSRDAWTSRFTTCCPNSASTRLKWR